MRTVTGRLHPALSDNLLILAGIQPCCGSAQRSHIASSTLCHGALTLAPFSSQLFTGWEFTASQILTPICTRRTTNHQSDNKNKSATHWTVHRWNAEWLENTTKLSNFIPGVDTHPPRKEQRESDLTTSTPVSVVSIPADTNGVWSFSVACECDAEEQTVDISSITVQSINLSLECIV